MSFDDLHEMGEVHFSLSILLLALLNVDLVTLNNQVHQPFA
jgi:hypothetical protein